jgi:endo-1,4-beta-D-glucanase Y
VVSVAPITVAMALVVWFVAACGSSTSTTSFIKRFSAKPEDKAVVASRRFLSKYVTKDGRVLRLDQGSDIVGEGQAYGMLMAAAIGDKKTFDAIWTWTKQNLRRPDGLISFLYKNGRVVDPQAASDADIDTVRALLVGACRFNQPGLKSEAIALAKSIMSIEVASVQGTPVLTAGPWAVKAPVTVNVSYFAPATFEAARAATGDRAWDALAESSRSITSVLMPSAHTLPPDWATLEGGKPKPIGNPGNSSAPVRFGFDAFRTLIRMAEDPNPTSKSIAARAWPVFESQDPSNMTIEYDLQGRPAANVKHPAALVAAAAAADAAGQAPARDGLLDQAEQLDRKFGTYYGSSWVALGRLYLTTHMLDVCS